MFYEEWLEVRESGNPDKSFIDGFLNQNRESLEVFLCGNHDSVIRAIKVLLSVPVSDFIESINKKPTFKARDVVQYSKLEDAITTVCNILEYEDCLLSYEDLGRQLSHATKQTACIKYGENHAKTAAALSLVIIEKKREEEKSKNMVRISPLGSVTTLLDSDNKIELIRRLAIRNPFIKTLIFNAKQGEVSYAECASTVLSGQTIVRRRHNNEILINIILRDDPLKNNIRW